ncbi:hypothetical protein PGO42_05175 [Klebsiella aerogenes]
MSTPGNLITNQSKDYRDYISCNSSDTATDEELSTMPTPFPNGSLTATTVGDIRALDDGWDVVPEPKKSNPVYASIIPPNGVTLTSAQAEALSGVFNSNPNQWKPSKK